MSHLYCIHKDSTEVWSEPGKEGGKKQVCTLNGLDMGREVQGKVLLSVAVLLEDLIRTPWGHAISLSPPHCAAVASPINRCVPLKVDKKGGACVKLSLQ